MKRTLKYILSGEPGNFRDITEVAEASGKHLDIIPAVAVYKAANGNLPETRYSITFQAGKAPCEKSVTLSPKDLGGILGDEFEVLFKTLEKAVEIAEELERKGLRASVKGRSVQELQQEIKKYVVFVEGLENTILRNIYSANNVMRNTEIARKVFRASVIGAYANYYRQI